MILSVVIPRHNDDIKDLLQTLIPLIEFIKDGNAEIVIVDSSDEICNLSGNNGVEFVDTDITIIRVKTASRGVRLQKGIDASTGRIVLLYHPRSVIDQEGLQWLYDKAVNFAREEYW